MNIDKIGEDYHLSIIIKDKYFAAELSIFEGSQAYLYCGEDYPYSVVCSFVQYILQMSGIYSVKLGDINYAKYFPNAIQTSYGIIINQEDIPVGVICPVNSKLDREYYRGKLDNMLLKFERTGDNFILPSKKYDLSIIKAIDEYFHEQCYIEF